MKQIFFYLLGLTLLVACESSPLGGSITVKDMGELNKAISEAKPGDQIIMSSGTWKNAQIKFYGEGTENKPITLKAEKAGETIIGKRPFYIWVGSI